MGKTVMRTYLDGVSVVIVTFNGSKRLKPTLIHLAGQQQILFPFEIVLVDNNSNDNTAEIVKEIWESLGAPFSLSVTHENTPGTMYARKKGIDESKYRYILYCDDDNWLSPLYVKTAYETISGDDAIAGVGGRGIIEYDEKIEVPDWIGPYEVNYGTGPQTSKTGDITDIKGCLYTAGAILDKIWIDRLYTKGFKSSLTGRIGNSLVAGEDTELTYALKLIGGRLYYIEEMYFHHYMSPGRINWAYLTRLYEAFGFSEYIISPYDYFFNNKKYPGRLNIIVSSLFDYMSLSAKIIWFRLKDGNFTILKLARKKGLLKAILFHHDRFKANRKMIEHLRDSKI